MNLLPDLDHIETLAKAATPKWNSCEWYGLDGGWAAIGPHHEMNENDDDDSPGSPTHQLAKRDAAFIAACSPDVLLALVVRVQELEKMLRIAKDWLERGQPQPPHEGSHTPESGCDVECMNEAQFTKDMEQIYVALTPPSKPLR